MPMLDASLDFPLNSMTYIWCFDFFLLYLHFKLGKYATT